MKNECNEVRALLHDYVDGELPDRDVEEIAAHLEKCSGCGDQADGIQRLKALVLTKTKRTCVPAGFEDRQVFFEDQS